MAASGTGMSGGCLCGAVRFTATPENRNVGACHCGMCRRWSAGPFLVLDDADIELAVDQAIICKFRNAGQACVAANRLQVEGVEPSASQLAKYQISSPPDFRNSITPPGNRRFLCGACAPRRSTRLNCATSYRRDGI